MEYLLSVSKLSEELYYLPLLKCFLFDAKRLILCSNRELSYAVIFYGHHWNSYFMSDIFAVSMSHEHEQPLIHNS